MNLLAKQKEIHKEIHRRREGIYGCWGEGMVREFGMDMYTQLCLKWITNKDLLYGIWSSAQCYVAAWREGSMWRMDTCMRMTESLHCSPETVTTLLIPIENNFFKIKLRRGGILQFFFF